MSVERMWSVIGSLPNLRPDGRTMISAVLVAGGCTYVLKKRKVDIAVVTIGIDYMQVLAVFATTEIEWPAILQTLYASLEIFSFNFLDIFPPECSLDVDYDVSWMAIQFAPLGLVAVAYGGYLAYYAVLNWKYAHQKKQLN